MKGWFRAGSSFPSRKSLVGVGFITKAAVPGRLALGVYNAPFFSVFRTIWGCAGPLCWGLWSEQVGEWGLTDFALVLVASWKTPEPHVAEPILVWLIWLWRVWHTVGLRLKLLLVFSCGMWLRGPLGFLFFGWDFLCLWLRVSALCLRTGVALPTVGGFPCSNGAILLRLVRVVLSRCTVG